MSKYYITLEVPDNSVVDLSKVIGTVELFHTPGGKAADKLLNTGEFNVSPYGFAELDENGNVTKFKLTGFSILHGGVNNE